MALGNFRRKAFEKSKGIGLFYYSGHWNVQAYGEEVILNSQTDGGYPRNQGRLLEGRMGIKGRSGISPKGLGQLGPKTKRPNYSYFLKGIGSGALVGQLGENSLGKGNLKGFKGQGLKGKKPFQGQSFISFLVLTKLHTFRGNLAEG